MRKKQKLLLIVCLFMVITIAVCLVMASKVDKGSDRQISDSLIDEEANTTGSIVPVLQTATSGIASEADSSNYSNSQYGFTIYFPQSWGKIGAVEGQNPGIEKVINFNIITDDPAFEPAGEVNIVKLYISTNEQWGSNRIGTILEQTSNNVFSYITWEKSPDDLQAITEKEIAQVLESFRLTN